VPAPQILRSAAPSENAALTQARVKPAVIGIGRGAWSGQCANDNRESDNYPANCPAVTEPQRVDARPLRIDTTPDGYCGLKGTGVSCPISGSVRVPAH
jgi:hypothetical protein